MSRCPDWWEAIGDFALKDLSRMGESVTSWLKRRNTPRELWEKPVLWKGQTIDKTKDTVQIYVGVESSETDEETED